MFSFYPSSIGKITMKLSKWILIPVMACALFSVGCTSSETSVIEVTEDEIQESLDADAAYDEAYGETMENYE